MSQPAADANFQVCLFLVAMIKIAGTKSNDKINFKEFVDFFYKVDWGHSKINDSPANTWLSFQTEGAWYVVGKEDDQIRIIYTNWVASSQSLARESFTAFIKPCSVCAFTTYNANIWTKLENERFGWTAEEASPLPWLFNYLPHQYRLSLLRTA